MNHCQSGMSVEVMHIDIKANEFPVGSLFALRLRGDRPPKNRPEESLSMVPWGPSRHAKTDLTCFRIGKYI